MEKEIRQPVKREQKENEEIVIDVKRVTKMTKGGRQYRFAATVVVGNRKGSVGLGTGRAHEVQDAVKKAVVNAGKNMINVPLIDGRTIPHEAYGISGAAKVLIKPAKAGNGIIAGGAVRAVLELAGLSDVISKSLGSNTKINIARATIIALDAQKTVEKVAELRGKSVEEILG